MGRHLQYSHGSDSPGPGWSCVVVPDSGILSRNVIFQLLSSEIPPRTLKTVSVYLADAQRELTLMCQENDLRTQISMERLSQMTLTSYADDRTDARGSGLFVALYTREVIWSSQCLLISLTHWLYKFGGTTISVAPVRYIRFGPRVILLRLDRCVSSGSS